MLFGFNFGKSPRASKGKIERPFSIMPYSKSNSARKCTEQITGVFLFY